MRPPKIGPSDHLPTWKVVGRLSIMESEGSSRAPRWEGAPDMGPEETVGLSDAAAALGGPREPFVVG